MSNGKHIHILGICGTFMGSLAILAKELGFDVSGSDANVYPPMSTQLEEHGIVLCEGYAEAHIKQNKPDLVIIGNALSRGNPAIEYVLNQGLPYVSGPQWLAEHVLQGKWVLAAAGTHGKTTTSSMLAWILECAGFKPGYLIGGVPKNFGVSARLGESDFFVIEADEYDSAFFDKRSKFVHYRPRTAIINNLEFDHADIFEDLAAIKKQMHHFVRTIPGIGAVITPHNNKDLDEVLAQGCWSERINFDGVNPDIDTQWQARWHTRSGNRFDVIFDGSQVGTVTWELTGGHNVNNALAALAAARHVGVDPKVACQALNEFSGVKRRMECIANINLDESGEHSVTVYDDFAHHPTAIETTLEGLRNQVGDEKIIAIIEPRSNTMRMGEHKEFLATSTEKADQVYWYQPANVDWDMQSVVSDSPVPAELKNNVHEIIADVVNAVKESSMNVHIVIMSNGGFEGIHQQLVKALEG